MIRIILSATIIILLTSGCHTSENEEIIMTVTGPVQAGKMSLSLVHEHILVDFTGGDTTKIKRWKISDVSKKALPFLLEAKELGCNTFVECTPVFLGRDPLLLKNLSESSGMNIITNTGYYVVPDFLSDQSADQFAEKWISEWEEGISGTGIRPGFIKLRVESTNLSEQSQKLIKAAARTHLKTGLVISSHTGPAIPAFQQIEILKNEGVSPEAFIWVHAQSEKNYEKHIEAARKGVWVSLDGLKDDNVNQYVEMLRNLKENNLLGNVLLSHDAGWYTPDADDGGNYRGYATLFKKLVPALRDENFSEKDINQLLIENPAKAFTIKIRKLKHD